MSKTINWSQYNKSLVNRGAITFWFSDEIFKSWYSDESRDSSQRGAIKTYSDNAIRILSIIRFKYRLTLRETQGFAQSLLKLMNIKKIEVPNYTTLCRRLRSLSTELELFKTNKKIHVLVDSTGLKVFGEGEWKVRQHGVAKRRTWRKLHIALDTDTQQVISASLTTNDFKDSEVIEDLINDLEDVDKVTGDGGYDSENCYEACESIGATPIFPPRSNAKIKRHGNCHGEPLPRDQHIREIREVGKKQWKVQNKYHVRSLVETFMYRFKKLVGGNLSSRNFDSQAQEIFIKCSMINKMNPPVYQ